MRRVIETTVSERTQGACRKGVQSHAAGKLPCSADSTRFSKHFSEPWLFDATLHNSLRAWVAACRSSRLRVPQVLDADRDALRIDYENLVGWEPVRTVIRHRSFQGLAPSELERMFWTIGAALEEFHRHTRRIHGDFDFDNVLVKRGADRAVFVDFTPPVYTNYREYNRADPYRDIVTFLLGVRAKYPPHLIHLALRPQLLGLARAFLEGYFRHAAAPYDGQKLARALKDILESTYLGNSFAGRFLRRSRLFRTDDLAPET